MIPTYHDHLAAMDHSKGTSNVMIQSAMKAEIMELRRALRAQEKAHGKALAAQHRELRRQIKKLQAECDSAKARAVQWRAYATRYQQLAAQR